MFSVYFAKCFRPARIISDHYKLNPVDLFPNPKKLHVKSKRRSGIQALYHTCDADLKDPKKFTSLTI